MSFNKFLNKRINKSADEMVSYSLMSMENRNAEDYFFNKSDLDKMAHYKYLTSKYKLCNKVYYYFNDSTKLWGEENTEDSVINRICDHSREILVPEDEHVKKILLDLSIQLQKKDKKSMTTEEQEKLEEVKNAIKEFNQFIDKSYKEHMKAKFAKSVLNFFHHKILDPDFMDKININNHHLLPLKFQNLNLRTLQMENRYDYQYFTKALDFFDIDSLSIDDEPYKIVDKFFLDISTGYEPKKQYLQKMLGYFLTGDVPHGRTFNIFYGKGRNGKSAVFEILGEIMQHYVKAVESSIIIKRGVKNAGQASPELEVLDYGLRLAILSETDEGDKLNESLIKNISGYDSISYRPLYGKPKNFRSEAKLCMLTNNKPYFKLSTSMVDRIRFINFGSRFLTQADIDKQGGKLNENEYKVDCELVKDIKTHYKQYVLLWLAIGAKKFIEDGHMNIPDDKILQTENMSYINEMDSFKRFMDECLVVDVKGKASASEVKEAYKKFCTDESIPPMKPAQLKEMLLENFTGNKNSSNMYYGFTIKTEQPESKLPDPSGLDAY
jgi:P4 family phage/plasmid primase-like protien